MCGDWLAERGDSAADVYYWQARYFKRPAKVMANWDWWNEESNNPVEIRLPTELWRLIEKQVHASWQNCKEFPMRLAADEALRAALRECADQPIAAEQIATSRVIA